MSISGTWLERLPDELQNMIYDIVYVDRKKEVLKDLQHQLCGGLLPSCKGTKHDMLVSTILFHDHESMFYDLKRWYKCIKRAGVIGKDSRHRIHDVILQSSPFFLYIEFLTYQELIEFNRYNVREGEEARRHRQLQ
jgi:hypothetical protein